MNFCYTLRLYFPSGQISPRLPRDIVFNNLSWYLQDFTLLYFVRASCMLKRLFRRLLKQFSRSNTLGRISRRNITNMFTFSVYLSCTRTWVLPRITQFSASAAGSSTRNNPDWEATGDVAREAPMAIKWRYVQEWIKLHSQIRLCSLWNDR